MKNCARLWDFTARDAPFIFGFSDRNTSSYDGI